MPLSRRFVILGLLIALAGFAFAVPAGALAQSAGDEQYVDPFQNEGGSGGGSGGNSGGGNTGAGQDPGTTGGDAGTDTTGGDAGATTVSPSPTTESATGTAAGDGATLPATGLPVAVAFGAGLLLLGGGFTLRRRP